MLLPETIRLSQPTKDQLLRLKRTTGVKQWNILCRWAFCLSLRDERALPTVEHAAPSNVEMTWKVFSGAHSHVYAALLVLDANRRHVPEAELPNLLQAHIRRGIGVLLLQQPAVAHLIENAA